MPEANRRLSPFVRLRVRSIPIAVVGRLHGWLVSRAVSLISISSSKRAQCPIKRSSSPEARDSAIQTPQPAQKKQNRSEVRWHLRSSQAPCCAFISTFSCSSSSCRRRPRHECAGSRGQRTCQKYSPTPRSSPRGSSPYQACLRTGGARLSTHTHTHKRKIKIIRKKKRWEQTGRRKGHHRQHPWKISRNIR